MHFIYELAKRYPQLVLPIKDGESKSEEYKNICLKLQETDLRPVFSFDTSDLYETYKTICGTVEIILLNKREDFEHMIKALGYKCEDIKIPSSTGAMTVLGLNNIEKFKAGQKDYKDTIIILSSGIYSNVGYKDINNTCRLNLTESEWTQKSIIIRKYHELTHFVMRKLYPKNINPIRDEIIADLIGIMMAFNKCDTKMLKLFLGIEDGFYRKGARLENYEGFDEHDIERVKEEIKRIESILKKYEEYDAEKIWQGLSEVL